MDRAHQEGPIAPPVGGPDSPGPPTLGTSLGAMPHLDRASWLVAAACAAWAAAFSWDQPRWTLLAVPLVLVGVGLLPRRTKTGAAFVVAAAFVTFVTGSAWGNIDMVVPVAVAMFALGRASDRRWHGVVAVIGAAVASSLRDGLTLDKVTITVVLYGVTWVFGLVVRRRALAAFAAVARAAVLANEDPVVPHEDNERLARELPSASLALLDGCGHVPHEECAPELLQLIDDWLAAQTLEQATADVRE